MSKTMLLRFRAADRAIFEALRDGSKTVETRAATARYRNAAAGDTLRFVCGKDSFERLAAKATRFPSVDALLAAYPVQAINPACADAEALKAMYASFPGYVDKIRECGIIALEIENA